MLTRVTAKSGFVRSNIARECGTCVHFDKGICKDDSVKADTQVGTLTGAGKDADGYWRVDAKTDCCDHWVTEEKKGGLGNIGKHK